MAASATSKRPAAPNVDPERRHGMAPVAAAAARVTGPLLKKRGLAEARIVTDWRAIVGDLVSARSAPERLVRARKADRDGGGGTLRLRVAGAWALEFQHMAPELLARINGYFGYPAVARIELVQAPLPTAQHRPRAAQPLTAEAEAALAARAAKIADPELRERVVAVGRALAQRAGKAGRLE